MTPRMNLTNDGKMDWFFQEWVYRNEIPKYKFDYELIPEGDKTRLKASLQQSGVSDQFIMAVPIHMDIDGRDVRLATVNIGGNSTISNIEVLLPQRPRKVAINTYFEVLSLK